MPLTCASLSSFMGIPMVDVSLPMLEVAWRGSVLESGGQGLEASE